MKNIFQIEILTIFRALNVPFFVMALVGFILGSNSINIYSQHMVDE